MESLASLHSPMEGLASLYTSFWAPSVWLPPNVTWDSFGEEASRAARPGQYAKFGDLLYPLPICLAMFLLRALVERVIFRPLGLRLGLKDRRRRLPEGHPVLERAHRLARPGWPGREDVMALAEDAKMPYIQVERWLRQRRQAALPNTLQKFQETGWRWMFYTWALLYGILCLWRKPWFSNIHHCWIDYPFHQVDSDVWVYYMVELSFYLTLSISQFFDVRRKDFWEMFIHHNTTIALLALSWTAHFTRIGTLVIVVHDCSDHVLELAKLFKYTRHQKTCTVLFSLFAAIWVVTRCGVFPAWILHSTLTDAGTFVHLFPLYYIFLVLLGLLQLLNLIWTFMLVKAIKSALDKSEARDTRSDSEPSTIDEDENDNDRKKKM